MNRFKLRLTSIACVSLGLLASTSAMAGFKTAQSVVISDLYQFANGMLGQVRNSSDTTQYIGCATWSGLGYCYAVNSAGVSRSCSTSDADMLATIRSLSSDSSLMFYWNSSGQCTFVEVDTSSDAPPKLL